VKYKKYQASLSILREVSKEIDFIRHSGVEDMILKFRLSCEKNRNLLGDRASFEKSRFRRHAALYWENFVGEFGISFNKFTEKDFFKLQNMHAQYLKDSNDPDYEYVPTPDKVQVFGYIEERPNLGDTARETEVIGYINHIGENDINLLMEYVSFDKDISGNQTNYKEYKSTLRVPAKNIFENI